MPHAEPTPCPGGQCPTPELTPTPTATPTPLRAVSGLKSRQHSSNGGRGDDYRSNILLEWDAQARDTTYEVQQKFGADWKTLPVHGFEIKSESDGDLSGAENRVIIKGFQFRATYEHRVRAMRGGLATEWVQLATEMPLPYLGTTVGMPIPDPDTVLTSSLTAAAAAWNAAISSGPSVVYICEVGQCARRHNDQRKVYVHVVPHNTPERCGRTARACITPLGGLPWADDQGHLKSLEIWIEQPGFYYDEIYIWTDNSRLQGREVMGVRVPSYPNIRPKWGYLGQTLIHELGHAIGLHDLYLFRPRILPSGSLMDGLDFDQNPGITYVPPQDAAYVEAVYQGHIINRPPLSH